MSQSKARQEPQAAVSTNAPNARKRGHRASGPVDAPVKISRESVADSPRRRARLQAYIAANLDAQTAGSLATSWSKAQLERDPAGPTRPERANHDSPLVRQWLEKTGLNSLDELRELIDQATLAAPAADAIEAAQAQVTAQDSTAAIGENNTVVIAENNTVKPTKGSTGAPLEGNTEQQKVCQTGRQETAVESAFRAELVPETHTGPASKDNVAPVADSNPAQIGALLATGSLPTRRSVQELRRSRSREQQSRHDGAGDTLTPSSISSEQGHLRASRSRVQEVRESNATQRRWRRFRLVAVVLTCLLVAVAGITLLGYYTRHGGTNEETTTQVEVLGSLGTEPVVSVSSPLPLTEKQSKVLIRGSGVMLEDDHNVLLRVSVFSGQDGHLLGVASESGMVAGKLSPEKTGTLLYEAVKGKPEGSRIVITQPVKQGGHSQMEIDVVDILYTQARGEVQELPADFPIGVSTTSARPVPEHRAAFGGELRVAPLIKGEGAKIEQGQHLLVNYLEYSYSDPPALLQDRWDAGGVRLTLGESVQSGIVQGLVDQSVGSRVVMLIPPAEGTGTSATIVIADVLAAWDDSGASSAKKFTGKD